MQEIRDYSAEAFVSESKNRLQYLFSKCYTIALVAIIAGAAGFAKAYFSPNIYQAHVTFFNINPASPKASSLSILPNGQTSSIVEDNTGISYTGNNITAIFSSPSIIKKTLLDTADINGKLLPLINHFLANHTALFPNADEVSFGNIIHSRLVDSALNVTTTYMLKNTIDLDFRNKKLNFITLQISDADELFAYTFMEKLTQNVVRSYEQYKTAEALRQVKLLQQNADSLKQIIAGNINLVAASTDQSVNFSKQKTQTGRLISLAELQAATTLFTEINRQLMFAKINLEKSRPLLEVIDKAKLPLVNAKIQFLYAIVVYGITGLFLSCTFLLVARKKTDYSEQQLGDIN